jgi:hypothetical protein
MNSMATAALHAQWLACLLDGSVDLPDRSGKAPCITKSYEHAPDMAGDNDESYLLGSDICVG